MTTSSAPGKVYLFGEHAVVYGEPAVPCAIERRARVSVEPRDDHRVRVESDDLTLDGFTVEWGGGADEGRDIDVPSNLVEAATGYVDEALAQARDALSDPEAGFDVHIESDIPLGGGLGSSAAVVVAAIDAAVRSRGESIDPETLADRAYQAEAAVQSGEASRADTYCSAMGGAVRVEGDDTRPIEAPELPLVIGYDGGAGDTGKLVAGVRALKREYGFAADTVETVGDLTREGEALLAEADPDGEPSPVLLDKLGELMDFNHGLLSALGVSSRSLDRMVWTAREAEAAGAKLTGAGGGGCIVALDQGQATRRALEYSPGCEEAFRAELATEGVRAEE